MDIAKKCMSLLAKTAVQPLRGTGSAIDKSFWEEQLQHPQMALSGLKPVVLHLQRILDTSDDIAAFEFTRNQYRWLTTVPLTPRIEQKYTRQWSIIWRNLFSPHVPSDWQEKS